MPKGETFILDGAKLRVLLAREGVSRKALADAINMTPFNVSRWAQAGSRSIRLENAQRACEFLGVPLEAIEAGAAPDTQDGPSESSAEADWLRVYRRLSPLGRARARLAVEEILSAETAHGPRR